MTWLTCTNRGAMSVNYEPLKQLGYGTVEQIAECEDSYDGDPDYGGVPMKIRPGMLLRLSRNLDKERGFCNGALGTVQTILSFGLQGVRHCAPACHAIGIMAQQAYLIRSSNAQSCAGRGRSMACARISFTVLFMNPMISSLCRRISPNGGRVDVPTGSVASASPRNPVIA